MANERGSKPRWTAKEWRPAADRRKAARGEGTWHVLGSVWADTSEDAWAQARKRWPGKVDSLYQSDYSD